MLYPKPPLPLDSEENLALRATLDSEFPERREVLHSLPYEVKQSLDIWSHSAILVDVATASVLYQKNATLVIPPASMTKLFVMAVLEEDIKTGKISLNDVVTLPPECYEENMPLDASIMGLHKGQIITVGELLLGLCVASANDAAIALAVHDCGNVNAFVERMNALSRSLHLFHTHFVEPSGYSEQNETTATEFAAFCLWYIRNFPASLAKYHSLTSCEVAGKTLYATNPLLGKMKGCDGLKTGFINESGYNIALTASRGERRYLSVTMKGPGSNAIEGNKTRVHDGTILMDAAFDNFTTFIDTDFSNMYIVKTPNATVKAVQVVQAFSGDMAVPRNIEITRTKELIPALYSTKLVKAGETIGWVRFTCESGVLQSIPLVCTVDIVPQKSFIKSKIDFLLYRIFLKEKSKN